MNTQMYQETRTVNDFAFLNSQSGRSESTVLFAAIFRTLYEHPDWLQLHAFFSKRYSRSQMLVDRDARKLTGDPDNNSDHRAGKKVTASFKTDPSSVGLPKDLNLKLATAGRTVTSGMLGPDPQCQAIGPAISVTVGSGAYMDLIYGGRPPGQYPTRYADGSKPFGLRDENYKPIAATVKGGRGRCWTEWEQLWSLIADWVYECDATLLQNQMFGWYSYKFSLSDQERAKLGFGSKIPREILSTTAIDAADAVRNVFKELAENPTKFHGIEWDFLELMSTEELRTAFNKRFGPRETDLRRRIESLNRSVELNDWDRLNYNEVTPVALKACPAGTNGLDWENWMSSIEGGNIVVVHTLFQALWAVIILSRLPVTIKVIDKEDRFPRYGDPNTVYM